MDQKFDSRKEYRVMQLLKMLNLFINKDSKLNKIGF